MRLLLCISLFAAFLPWVPVAQADSATGMYGAAANGEQVDERQRLVQRLLETSKTLIRIKTDYVGDESKLQLRLNLLASKLRRSSSPRVRSYRTEVRDLRRDLGYNEFAVKSALHSIRYSRESLKDVPRQFRTLSKAYIHDDEKRMREGLAKKAQGLERHLRDLAVKEPKFAKELSAREDLSRTLTDLAKLLDESRHR